MIAIIDTTTNKKYLSVVLVGGVENVRSGVDVDGHLHLQFAQPLQTIQTKPICHLHRVFMLLLLFAE